MTPIPELTSRERSAALLGRPWTVAEVVKDLARPGLTQTQRDVSHRRLAMAILSSPRGVDASTSSQAFRKAWRAATMQIARKRPKIAVWTPERLRLRAAGYVVLPEGYRP